jgi:hypothetical protein
MGLMLNDNNIRSDHIIEHLTDLPGMSLEKAYQLLDPADKQNVPKAVTLLQSLLQLKDLPLPPNPTVNTKRHAIVFMAEMIGYFLRPFISINMTLSEQVKCLATYSFLAAGVQIKHGTACMTGVLYADSQATVKNIIFTIARLQEIDPTLELYILHEGTDRLERLFGDCRSLDHARNFDAQQLPEKLSIATLINSVMERNPDLDKGHRRLSLKNAMGIDHVNPKSWEGKVCVGDVNLKDQWNKGQKEAEKILQKFYGHEFDFKKQFSSTQYDLLRPRGNYVGVQATSDDARSEEERTTPLPRPEAISESASLQTDNVEHIADTEEGINPDRSGYNDHNHDFDDPLGMDIENFLPDTPEDIDKDVEPEMFSKWLDLDGKQVLKTSVVATLSTAFSKKLSVQTLRNMGMTLEGLLNSKKYDELDPDNMNGEDVMKKGDPVACLVQSGTKICLAVIEVIGFRFGNEKNYKNHSNNG